MRVEEGKTSVVTFGYVEKANVRGHQKTCQRIALPAEGQPRPVRQRRHLQIRRSCPRSLQPDAASALPVVSLPVLGGVACPAPQCPLSAIENPVLGQGSEPELSERSTQNPCSRTTARPIGIPFYGFDLDSSLAGDESPRLSSKFHPPLPAGRPTDIQHEIPTSVFPPRTGYPAGVNPRKETVLEVVTLLQPDRNGGLPVRHLLKPSPEHLKVPRWEGFPEGIPTLCRSPRARLLESLRSENQRWKQTKPRLARNQDASPPSCPREACLHHHQPRRPNLNHAAASPVLDPRHYRGSSPTKTSPVLHHYQPPLYTGDHTSIPALYDDLLAGSLMHSPETLQEVPCSPTLKRTTTAYSPSTKEMYHRKAEGIHTSLDYQTQVRSSSKSEREEGLDHSGGAGTSSQSSSGVTGSIGDSQLDRNESPSPETSSQCSHDTADTGSGIQSDGSSTTTPSSRSQRIAQAKWDFLLEDRRRRVAADKVPFLYSLVSLSKFTLGSKVVGHRDFSLCRPFTCTSLREREPRERGHHGRGDTTGEGTPQTPQERGHHRHHGRGDTTGRGHHRHHRRGYTTDQPREKGTPNKRGDTQTPAGEGTPRERGTPQTPQERGHHRHHGRGDTTDNHRRGDTTDTTGRGTTTDTTGEGTPQTPQERGHHRHHGRGDTTDTTGEGTPQERGHHGRGDTTDTPRERGHHRRGTPRERGHHRRGDNRGRGDTTDNHGRGDTTGEGTPQERGHHTGEGTPQTHGRGDNHGERKTPQTPRERDTTGEGHHGRGDTNRHHGRGDTAERGHQRRGDSTDTTGEGTPQREGHHGRGNTTNTTGEGTPQERGHHGEGTHTDNRGRGTPRERGHRGRGDTTGRTEPFLK
ncbi:hypothetical protein KUCAC02_035300 [Chaenocephalus aceratus]|nr:hypothetical protein KUCAC02_035300 [Chaenocephalus aceratus]